MKATEQYFPVVLFILLYKVVLTFESVDKILQLQRDHSNESYCSCGVGNSRKVRLTIFQLHSDLVRP